MNAPRLAGAALQAILLGVLLFWAIARLMSGGAKLPFRYQGF
jgi:hypothetical protein